MEAIKRADFRHFVPITVRWGDMDVLGHVNNTLFYRYSEEGRICYFQDVGVADPTDQSSGPILADLRCQFVQQLRYPAEVEVATRICKFGNSSIRMKQALYHKGGDDLVAIFDAVVVWFDYEQQSPASTPETIRKTVREFETVTPD